MRKPPAVPDKPPAPRAPAVPNLRPSLERELSDLKLQIAERALAAYEQGGDGRQKLADLDAQIRAVSFQIECNAAAHQLAQRLDREAVIAWRDQVQADPKLAIEGITKDKCCRRCCEATGCIITGEGCGHPIKVGSVGPRMMGNQVVRAVFKAAVERLEVYR